MNMVSYVFDFNSQKKTGSLCILVYSQQKPILCLNFCLPDEFVKCYFAAPRDFLTELYGDLIDREEEFILPDYEETNLPLDYFFEEENVKISFVQTYPKFLNYHNCQTKAEFYFVLKQKKPRGIVRIIVNRSKYGSFFFLINIPKTLIDSFHRGKLELANADRQNLVISDKGIFYQDISYGKIE